MNTEKKTWLRPEVRCFGTVDYLTRARQVACPPPIPITKVCGMNDAVNHDAGEEIARNIGS